MPLFRYFEVSSKGRAAVVAGDLCINKAEKSFQ